MKRNKSNFRSLNLGKELSKNSQKKVLGGAWIHCTDGSYYTSACVPAQMAYCQAANHGQYLGCTP
jgi:hypothetical protein